MLQQYPLSIFNFPKSWIFCEKQIQEIDEFAFKKLQERFFWTFGKKIKTDILFIGTNQSRLGSSVVLFLKNFGLNTNGEIFLKSHKIFLFNSQKESFEVENLEALIFWNRRIIDSEKEDNYFKDLKFRYLLHKYQLEKKLYWASSIFKHRPDNFPTIRFLVNSIITFINTSKVSMICFDQFLSIGWIIINLIKKVQRKEITI
jgi:hypothetical protein